MSLILPPGPFDIIYADPPWRFATRSDKGRDRCPDGMVQKTTTRGAQRSNIAERHYPTMSTEEICALPVKDMAAKDMAAKDSVLLMWVIDPMLPQAMQVLDAWGFEFKTVGFYWAKLNKAGDGFPMGTGYYTRANPEQCWLATRGKSLKRLNGGVAKLIEADPGEKLIVSPRREHSRKPDEAYGRIDKLWGPDPINRRVEMFARQAQPGWTAWGNQTEKFEPPPKRDRLPFMACEIDGEVTVARPPRKTADLLG